MDDQTQPMIAPEDWPARLRAQRDQLWAVLAVLERHGDQAGVARIQDQLSQLDALLTSLPAVTDQLASVTLVRGLLVQGISLFASLLDTASPTARGQRPLRQALAAGHTALDLSPAEILQTLLIDNLLGHVQGELGRGDHHRLTWQRQLIAPLGIAGVVVTAAGLPGQAVVVPALPSTGPVVGWLVDTALARELTYELRIASRAGDDWPTQPVKRLISPEATAIVAAIRAWRDATPLPAPTLRSIGAADLAPLRALATVRQTLTRMVQAGADWTALGIQSRLEPSRLDDWQWPVAASTTASSAPSLAISGAGGQLLAESHPALLAWLAGGGEHQRPPPIRLAPAGVTALRDDLAAIDAARLLANVPRDARGQLALGQDVLLAPYETLYGDEPAGRRARLWLVARLPQRRRDAQMVSLDLDLVLGDGRRHRWDAARWLWDGRAPTDEATRWGVAGLPIQRLGLADRTATIDRWRRARDGGNLAPAERVGLVMLLQDEGELVDAFQTGGVELDPGLLALLAGSPTISLTAKEALTWPVALQEALRQAAPWRFASILAADEHRRALRAAGKPRRGGQSPRLRLLALPHQTQVRKTSIMLVRGAQALPRLEIETTGAEAIVAEVLWRRPLELDLVRFGLVD